MDSSTFTLRAGPFPIYGVSGKFLFLPSFLKLSVFNANSVDPDQTPRVAASDLGLNVCQCPFNGTLGLRVKVFEINYIPAKKSGLGYAIHHFYWSLNRSV